MHEIDLRIWDNKRKKFLYLDNSDFELSYAGAYETLEFGGMRLINGILEQSTGLRDKGGRKIYEGDILTRRVSDYLGNEYSRAGVVQYARGIFGVNWDYSKNKDPEWSDGGMYGGWGKRHNLRSLDDDLIEAMEIIGNIHENPELLA